MLLQSIESITIKDKCKNVIFAYFSRNQYPQNKHKTEYFLNIISWECFIRNQKEMDNNIIALNQPYAYDMVTIYNKNVSL